MITTADIANILYRDCKSFDIAIVPFGKKMLGELQGERITIHSKKQLPETYWRKSFVEVNFCVPDIGGEANTIRLEELEKQAQEAFDGVTGSYDGSSYLYSIESVGIEEDTALKCHYVNVRLLFEVLNVK